MRDCNKSTKDRLISAAGQPCRKCGGPVTRHTHEPEWEPKIGQPYYFEWWFKCHQCRTIYMVEAAKRPNLRFVVSTNCAASRPDTSREHPAGG